MNDHLFNLGDTIEIDGIKMHVGEIRLTFGGVKYLLWWLVNGDIHDGIFFEGELVAMGIGNDKLSKEQLKTAEDKP